MTEHYALCQLERGALALPEKFSSLKRQSHSIGRPRGRPKGNPKRVAKAPARGRGGGRSGRGGCKRKASEGSLPDPRSAEATLAECFALDPLEVASAEGETAAPGTLPEVAARFAIMIEEGILPDTTQEMRRCNVRAQGTQYGVPEGLPEALDYGYIHPNLPAPPGMVCKRTAYKTMQLVARGG